MGGSCRRWRTELAAGARSSSLVGYCPHRWMQPLLLQQDVPRSGHSGSSYRKRPLPCNVPGRAVPGPPRGAALIPLDRGCLAPPAPL